MSENRNQMLGNHQNNNYATIQNKMQLCNNAKQKQLGMNKCKFGTNASN
jgi:hypothetical protein